MTLLNPLARIEIYQGPLTSSTILSSKKYFKMLRVKSHQKCLQIHLQPSSIFKRVYSPEYMHLTNA